MRLSRLDAVTFRNYESLTFEPHPRCTVLCGRNGQGKTNIIEAIGLLATARSHRGAKDRELTYWEAQGYRLDGRFQNEDTDGLECRTVLVFDGRTKTLEFDGVPQEKLSALLGRSPVAIFAPEDLSLVKDGPAERRRLLDMSLSQLSATYLAALQTYTRALKQRNRALKDWLDGRVEREMVTVWNPQLVEAGSIVQSEREEYVQAMGQEAVDIYSNIAHDGEVLSVDYRPSVKASGSPAAIEETFFEQLEQQSGKERGLATTPCGPHRDDVQIELDGKPLKLFGSQGQHRSTVLALKLGDGILLQKRSPTAPIILLDDFASELDEGRQAAILEVALRRGQVVITTTELTEPLRALADKGVYTVQGGTLVEGT